MGSAARAAVVLGAACAGYAALVRGSLTADLGIGRRNRPLGPMTFEIAAPRETVFDVIAAPYVGKTPRAMAEKLAVWERGDGMVLAAHHTPVGAGLVTTTVETVRFERPGLIAFRLVRGPVPHVAETFDLRESDGGTTLVYEGELGTDLWALGRLWGDRVARSWEEAVRESLAGVREEAERRAR